MVVTAQVVVSSSGCATLPRQTLTASDTGVHLPKAENDFRININTASAPELQKLPGIGLGIAGRIVAHRLRYGPFHRPEHLMMVRGISDRKFREIQPMIVVE